jgi:hypothetical protein
MANPIVTPLVSRQLTEYVLPVATETHELALVPNSDLLLVTQMSDSRTKSKEPVAFSSFLMGNDSGSGLHGVWPSAKYPGYMWLSLQGENKLLLVDPRQDLAVAPTVIVTIDIPKPGNGPHCVFEIDDRVWTGLKAASRQTGNTTSSRQNFHTLCQALWCRLWVPPT